MTTATRNDLFAFSVQQVDQQAAALRESFGTRVSSRARRGDPLWERQILETEVFMNGILGVPGYRPRPSWQFLEAMSTSDFPALFTDSLDRQLYAAYQATMPTWSNYARAATVNDFRTVKRFATSGVRGLLQKVGELAEHERRAQTETPYEYGVAKYEAGFAVSWETMVNDDLDAFRRLPNDLADSVRDSEEHFVTSLFVDANGPHASFYTAGNGNILTGNPALTRETLQDAITVLMKRTDDNGNPIVITAVELVVGPGLALAAQQIIDAVEYRAVDSAGNVTIIRGNGVGANLRPSVNYWIPSVASTANADTSWFVFANPNNQRPALEFGRLRGFEAPALYEKIPDMRRIGGGVEDFSFDTEAQERKVKHVYGGSRVDHKMTVASNGSGVGS